MFLEGTRVGIRYYSPTEAPPVIFMNSVDGTEPEYAPNQWNNVVVPSIKDDPSNGIPDDCIAVFLCGILIITNGYASESADMHVRFRRWLSGNNTYFPPYILQAVSNVGGARHPFSLWVPVDTRRFQFYWTRSTQPPWPQHASYGLNAYVSDYLSP
jgi:hypothetical protein